MKDENMTFAQFIREKAGVTKWTYVKGCIREAGNVAYYV